MKREIYCHRNTTNDLPATSHYTPKVTLGVGETVVSDQERTYTVTKKTGVDYKMLSAMYG